MESELCYIDRRLCTGARFCFCDDCKIAKRLNAKEIRQAKTPLELTAAHCLSSEQKKNLRRRRLG